MNMTFQTVWFLLIAVLWVGYFILEGFDFGVGMLLRYVSRNEADRRAVLTTLGPVWDGNEVWLLVAGGATSLNGMQRSLVVSTFHSS
jgi:cytochrome d ubiquinol oxidase subunit II